MDAIKEDVGGVVGDNHEQGIMQCSDHPYNRNNPGGICAFCLKEKLGKLVSSPSFPLPVRASSSSSPSPSFRSNIVVASTTAGGGGGAVTDTANAGVAGARVGVGASLAVTRKGKIIPFLLAKKKKPTKRLDHDVVLKRSKSTTTPRRSYFDFGRNGVDFSPRTKKGTSFWSFLYMSSSSSTTTKPTITKTTPTPTRPTYGPAMKSNDDKSIRDNNIVIVEEGGDDGHDNDSGVNINSTQGNNDETSQTTSSCFERKVSRSRSVGCGSRSFSGDFFERISSGCGDCTSLRRVESQREGSSKANKEHRGTTTTNPNMKERVKCGRIFGGFTINSSSSSSFSSSSSSSSYWVSSSSSSGEEVNNGKSSRVVHSRNRSWGSWGWALASPMRAFGRQSSKDGNNSNKNTKTIRESSTDKNTTSNLSARK